MYINIHIYLWKIKLFQTAIVPVGSKTLLHKHHTSEEIYYILEGQGLMTLNNEKFEVKKGDTIYIPPKNPHKIENIGNVRFPFP